MEILEHHTVASVTGDFPVGFSACFSGDQLFIAYYDENRHLAVSTRSPDGDWSHVALPSKVGWDTHRAIVMAVDRADCVHVSANMHADPLVYFKTSEPHDIQSFEAVGTQVDAQDEARCTYPRFLKAPDDALLYTYRNGGSGNGATIVNRYDEASGTFSRLSDQPLFDGLGEMSAYHSGPVRGPDGKYHMTWVWRNTPHCETNHDLSYAVSTDVVRWAPMKGNPMDLPITPRTDAFVVDPVPPGGGTINGGSALAFDPEGRPVIAYYKYDENGNTQTYVARTQADGWVTTCVSEWDYRWEFSGPGSITFEVQIGRPTYMDQETIVIPYWHVKRGNGELHLESETLALIEDRSVETADLYPVSLQNPTSGLEGVSVKWLPINPPESDPSARYVLRWETMGKRRFYEPPDEPIDPVPMVLYRFGTESG